MKKNVDIWQYKRQIMKKQVKTEENFFHRHVISEALIQTRKITRAYYAKFASTFVFVVGVPIHFSRVECHHMVFKSTTSGTCSHATHFALKLFFILENK
jgi:hypothetical protein